MSTVASPYNQVVTGGAFSETSRVTATWNCLPAPPAAPPASCQPRECPAVQDSPACNPGASASSTAVPACHKAAQHPMSPCCHVQKTILQACLKRTFPASPELSVCVRCFLRLLKSAYFMQNTSAAAKPAEALSQAGVCFLHF